MLPLQDKVDLRVIKIKRWLDTPKIFKVENDVRRQNMWYYIVVCKLFVLSRNTWNLAQLAGAVEYIDCFSAEG